jgi:serine/threonine protein kinase
MSMTGRPTLFGRIGRALASPVGVVITLPAIVILAGVAILLVGRDTTRTASETLARRQLAEQAQQIEREVQYALDQAEPMLQSLKGIADQSLAFYQVGPHLYDLAIGRAGVKFISISYPDGRFQAARRMDDGSYRVEESRVVGEGRTEVSRYKIHYGGLDASTVELETTDYDPRERDFYKLAQDKRARTWTTPYTFYKTHETGITCVDASIAGDKSVLAVLTVDFDVRTLSSYIGRQPVEGARTIVFDKDGTLLAYSDQAALAKLPAVEGKPLQVGDLGDAGIKGVLGKVGGGPIGTLTYLDIGDDLASVAPIGGKRAGAANALDWYVATLVPADTLLGPSRALAGRSITVSVIALALAVGVALILALNIVRMRQAVVSARARVRAAEDRARELGSWRLVEKLGAGGMGEVWRAEHRLLVRQAAIKLMTADPKASAKDAAETRERFRREAQVLASLKSRHTIEIFDYGVTEDMAFYYVMELLDGLDLDTLTTKFGPQPAARVIQILTQSCLSLAEAHDSGLLHRDIKPANIFICRAADEVDLVKVLDFGIVQVIGTSLPVKKYAGPTPGLDEPITGDRMTEFGTVLGTPGFMAPEQARGQKLDPRTDLYALGCVAWMLLTGREVFDRTTYEQLLFQHVVEPVPSLARRVPGWVPPGLVDIVTACLAKDPAQRPKNARTMAAMLRGIDIPTDHAWTVAKAQDWWKDNVPKVDPARAGTSTPGKLLVPFETDGSVSNPAAATVRGPQVPSEHGAPNVTGSPPTVPG